MKGCTWPRPEDGTGLPGSEVVLSIVVPLLNEAPLLPRLLDTLARQQGIAYEVLLCDGGSTDGSPELAARLLAHYPVPASWLSAPRGRAPQMNTGAAAARGTYLLFLHADSRFPAADALATGVAALVTAGPRAAARFALSFDRSHPEPSFPYYFYEAKARLNRPGCIHGDQGMLLSRDFFLELGGFDASLSLLEDDRLAAQVFSRGRWLLVPRTLVTSARRFEVEGLYERQCLNALLCDFAAIGWNSYFDAARDLYRSQDRAARLRLAPFLARVDELLAALPGRERRRLWRATGAYVRSQAWQAALLFDLRRNYRGGHEPGSGPLPRLARHDRWFERCTGHRGGELIATALVWIWFRLQRLRHRE